MDNLNPEQRRRTMAAVKSRDTTPELIVRRLLHEAGFRFRLCRKDLPGKPDIVLPKYRTVIFVNGCFWHQHPGCKHASMPESQRRYWQAKLDRNVGRDAKNQAELTSLGWKVVVVWECETRKAGGLTERLLSCLTQRETLCQRRAEGLTI